MEEKAIRLVLALELFGGLYSVPQHLGSSALLSRAMFGFTSKLSFPVCAILQLDSMISSFFPNLKKSLIS